uniref:Ig-like domain-containing protein n=1 Tax=Denticeps clupeoides TaxID=299321 RepID=A0AAY3ZZE5_9TELE
TCLFNAHIASGNASLLLRKVKVQDRGRYKCYTSTRKATIPMVKIEMTEETVTCLSQNIYPAPEVLWFTDPPTVPGTLLNSTQKMPDSRGLFTVESTVEILGNQSDYTYFCSIISADGSQVWTASRRHEGIVDILEVLIPCTAPKALQNFTLTWTFTRKNEPMIILTYDSRNRRITNLWESQVALDQDQVILGNGSLQLPNPESEDNTGSYTCIFSGFQTKHIIQSWVNITVRRIDKQVLQLQSLQGHNQHRLGQDVNHGVKDPLMLSEHCHGGEDWQRRPVPEYNESGIHSPESDIVVQHAPICNVLDSNGANQQLSLMPESHGEACREASRPQTPNTDAANSELRILSSEFDPAQKDVDSIPENTVCENGFR